MEIKFRVWDKFQEKYIFTGFHVIGEITVFGGIEQEIIKTAKERREKYGYKSTIEAWDDFIVEQFTGRQDKYNKDIYVGDVIKGPHPYCRIKKVIFDESTLQFCTKGHNSLMYKDIEIIGNIHEKYMKG